MALISNVAPELLSTIARTQAVTFDLEEPDPFFVIWVDLPGIAERLLVWDGDGFVVPFVGQSRVTIDAGVWSFSILPDTGWPAGIDAITIEPAEPRPSVVEFIGATTGGFSEGTDGTLLIPLGAQAGDFCVYCLQNATTSPFPAGFTEYANYFRSHFGGGTRHQAAWKWLSQGDIDGTWFDLINAGGGAISGTMAVYRNVHPDNPIADSRIGTNTGDPEIVCPGVGCHTAAVSGAGNGTVSYWGPGFLTPYNMPVSGCMMVYTLGGGSGGGSAFTATMAGPSSSSYPVTNSYFFTGQGVADPLRVRGSGIMSWPSDDSLSFPTPPPRWDGASIIYNQGLGTSLILRPQEGL